MFIFPVQLTTSRIGNLTRLIHILLYVMTIRTSSNYGVPVQIKEICIIRLAKSGCLFLNLSFRSVFDCNSHYIIIIILYYLFFVTAGEGVRDR